MTQGTCQLAIPDAPEAMKPQVQRVVGSGAEFGIIVSMVCRPTRAEAVAAAQAATEGLTQSAAKVHREFRAGTDSVAYRSAYELADRERDWVTPYLWAGAVPYMGAPSIALVGSPDDITNAIFEYRDAGVTHFLSMGWPDEPELTFFGEEVLPRVREREQRRA